MQHDDKNIMPLYPIVLLDHISFIRNGPWYWSVKTFFGWWGRGIFEGYWTNNRIVI